MQRLLARRLVGLSFALGIVALGAAPGIGCGDKDEDTGGTGTIGTTDGGTADGGTTDGGTTEPEPISAAIHDDHLVIPAGDTVELISPPCPPPP